MGNNYKLPKTEEIKYFQKAEYKREINSAKHKLRAQPFIERFSVLYILAKIGTVFFPVISIVTGVAFIYNYAFSISDSIYISITVSLVVLSFLEFIKNNLLNNGLHTFFSNSGKPTAIFMFALLFSVGSFILSYQGAELLVKNLDRSKQQITDRANASITGITSKYADAIILEQSKINALRQKAKSQWRGLNTTEQNKLFLIYEQNIQQFLDQEQNQIDLALSKKENNLIQAETAVNYNAYVFKIFAGINELLTVLSIAFLPFYAFKIVQQEMDLIDYKQNPGKYNKSSVTAELIPAVIEAAKHISLNNIPPERKVIHGFLRRQNDMQERSSFDGERTMMIKSNKRICKNCGKEFEYKHWNKKYCTDACRIEHWQMRTGKKFKFKKSKAAY